MDRSGPSAPHPPDDHTPSGSDEEDELGGDYGRNLASASSALQGLLRKVSPPSHPNLSIRTWRIPMHERSGGLGPLAEFRVIPPQLGAGFDDILPPGLGYSSGRLKGILANLKKDDSPHQMEALSQLCELLSISTEVVTTRLCRHQPLRLLARAIRGLVRLTCANMADCPALICRRRSPPFRWMSLCPFW